MGVSCGGLGVLKPPVAVGFGAGLGTREPLAGAGFVVGLAARKLTAGEIFGLMGSAGVLSKSISSLSAC